MSTDIHFETLHATVDRWLIGVCPLSALKELFDQALLQYSNALGDRHLAYRNVLDQLYMRIEAAASFTEESCSFSQGDFAGSLHDWLNKLEARLSVL